MRNTHLSERRAPRAQDTEGVIWRLRAELDEARSTIDALIRGEIDTAADATGAPLLLREAQRALRESRERLSAIFDGALEGMILVDHGMICRTANSAARAILAFGDMDLSGRTLAELWEARGVGLPDLLDAAVRLRGPRMGEIDLPITDGGNVRLEFCVQHDVLPGRHLLSIRDVTDRTRLQEQLVQAQRREAVGQLAGGVAHDFNNLLTAILGHGQYLTEGLSANDPLLEDARAVVSSAERAARLTRQLLTYTRQDPVLPRRLSINDVVRELEPTIARLLGESVRLEIDLAPDAGDILADPSQIEHLIFNLVINSRDALPGGGRVTIVTGSRELGHEAASEMGLAPGAYTVLRVEDDGLGMSADTLRHLFEPFYTTKEVGRGTGLGLATVQGIVDRLDGAVVVRSSPGEGAAFTFHLPRAGAGEEDDDREDGDATGMGEHAQERTSRVVLLVEDESVVRSLIVRILESAGFRVMQAESATQALGLVDDRGDEIDLVVTDVRLPDLAGPDMMRRLRDRGPDLPTLFISGYAEDALTGLPEDARFLPKPFSRADLLGEVGALIA